jgi:hypothetical protein
MTAAVVWVESSRGQISISQVVLALDLVADMLLDTKVEILVIRV